MKTHPFQPQQNQSLQQHYSHQMKQNPQIQTDHLIQSFDHQVSQQNYSLLENTEDVILKEKEECKKIRIIMDIKSEKNEKFEGIFWLFNQQDYKIEIPFHCPQDQLFQYFQNNQKATYLFLKDQISQYPSLVKIKLMKVHGWFSISQKTILFVAAEKKLLKIVDLFLSEGANVNEQEKITGNVLMHKIIKDFTNSSMDHEIMAIVLKFKPDLSIKNFQNQTPYDVAETYLFDLQVLVNKVAETMIKTEAFNSTTQADFSDYQREISDQQSDDSDSENEETDVEQLSTEIFQHAEKCFEIYQNVWKEIQPFFFEVQKIGLKFSLQLHIIGSFATGLWTPFQDIDFAFINTKENYVDLSNVLKQIYQIFKKNIKKLGIDKIFTTNEQKFPNIKIILHSEEEKRKIDIGIYQKRTSVFNYVNFVRNSLSQNPLIHPLFFLLYSLLDSFHLILPIKSGLKTYGIFLMILQVAQTYPTSSITDLFFQIVEYYRVHYQYEQVETQNGEVNLKFNLPDPLNKKNNVGGKETNVKQMLTMFQIIHCGLKVGVRKNILPYLFNLQKISEK